jgi:hypothetical protein
MLRSLPEAIREEIDERHENRERSSAPDTLFQFRDEVTRIVTPILERRMHDPLHRTSRAVPMSPTKTCCAGCTCGRKPPESFLG